MSPTPKPLAGIRVLDFTTMIAGPYCSRMLADCGAEIIKLEEPSGDHMRNGRPLRDGFSAYFGHLNCGKRSVALDLKTREGKEIATRLATESDIVLENFRPGTMKRLGLDYDAIKSKRPDLIYCAISGFGQSGPRAGQPAYAPVVHAASGFDLIQSLYQDNEARPSNTGIFVADVLGAIYAFGAIQTALIGRLRHNRGQFIDVALMDSMINLLVYECQEAQFPQDTRRHVYMPLAAQDGFVVVTPVNKRNYDQLVAAIGRPEWKNDARFATAEARTDNWRLLMTAVEDWTRKRTARQCEDALMTAGVPCSRYRTVAEALSDPQIVLRGAMAHAEDGAGLFLVPQLPFRFADGSVDVSPKVPALGEGTRELLSGLLGMEQGTIDDLMARNVLAAVQRS